MSELANKSVLVMAQVVSFVALSGVWIVRYGRRLQSVQRLLVALATRCLFASPARPTLSYSYFSLLLPTPVAAELLLLLASTC